MKKPVKKTKATKPTAASAARSRIKAAVARSKAHGGHLRAGPKTAAQAKRSALAKKKAVKKKAVKRTLSLNDRNVITWKDRLVKLGRNAKHDEAEKPRLELDKYLDTSALAVPSVVDFASEVLDWPVYGNDQIGDCTAACVGHQIQAWTRYTGAEVDIPEDEIIQLYSAVSGYDPKTGAHDDGAVIQDVLTLWRQSGVPVAGHRILAFAELKDLSKVHDALWMFGSVYLGFNCPESALSQFDADEPWTVVQDSPIAGGHAVPVQYAASGTDQVGSWSNYQVVTWGKLQGMTQAFLDTYVDEAWVIITDDWLDKNGHTPEGLDLQALGADLAALTGDPNPFPAPTPPGPPAPPQPTPKPVPAPDAVKQLEADLEQTAKDLASVVQDVEKVL